MLKWLTCDPLPAPKGWVLGSTAAHFQAHVLRVRAWGWHLHFLWPIEKPWNMRYGVKWISSGPYGNRFWVCTWRLVTENSLWSLVLILVSYARFLLLSLVVWICFWVCWEPVNLLLRTASWATISSFSPRKAVCFPCAALKYVIL